MLRTAAGIFVPARSRPGLLARLELMLAARRQRRALRALPQERLDDIGVTRAEAAAEAARAAWDVPAHWLK